MMADFRDRQHTCHACKKVWVYWATKPDVSCPFCSSSMVTFTVVIEEAA